MQKQNNTPEEILKAIKSAQNIVILMDSRFDFDMLSSTLSMEKILYFLDKHVDIFYEDKLPSIASEMMDISSIKQSTNYAEIDYKKYDLLMLLDSGGLGHLTKAGDFVPPSDLTSMVFDHHETNELYGTLNYVLKNRASTCSVLLELLEGWNIAVNPAWANILLLGILTDTGFLQYSNTTPAELRAVAKMVDTGADLYNLTWKLTFNVPIESFKFDALVLKNMNVERECNFAYSFIRQSDIASIGRKEEIEALSGSDVMKRLKDVDFVVFIKENDIPYIWSVSFRAHKIGYDVSVLAKKFGGGGHKAAAGGKVSASSVEEVVKKIIEALN